ncbi:hypothetical protein MMC07_002465 [Pseudocyphellaria aurata]|nr:hypothetical protein [Pseudocyphellaria aurata]
MTLSIQLLGIVALTTQVVATSALNPVPISTSAVYARGDSGIGIGGYDLKSNTDRILAFDYDHSGKNDHLVLTRPGTGTVWILKNTAGTFAPVYQQGDPVRDIGGQGIGGFDLKSPADKRFAFDYDHSGKLDHLCFYRPGTGIFSIVKHTNGNFSSVFRSNDSTRGIGGFDLRSPNDLAFALDYDHTGKQDHIALYRPGTGAFMILKNSNGTFQPVYRQGDPGRGIGGYDLKNIRDRAFAFDYDRSGYNDHIALYRPGTGTFWIIKNRNGLFEPVYKQGDPGSGIGGYDLKSPQDKAFSFDADNSGRDDHLVLYRPGSGAIFIIKNFSDEYLAVYHEGDSGQGIGQYDLKNHDDIAFGFDYESTGRSNYLTLYRPGTGRISILKLS